MCNFALLVVILTWQRMLLEHFHENNDETFFELGNYSPRGKRYMAAPLDNLYLTNKGKRRVGKHKFLALTALRSRRNCLFFNEQITSSNKMLIWRPPVKKNKTKNI
jgi:hypothetical protein